MLCLMLLVALLLPLRTQAQPWTGILDPARAADWSAAGVVGDIPSSSWTNCTSAACNTLFGGSVTATTIGNALGSCGTNEVVRIPAGTFSVGAFNHTRTNCVLRGAGSTATKLNMTSAQSGAGRGGSDAATIHLMQGTTNTAKFGGISSTTWTAGYALGTTVITVGSTSGLTAGAPGSGTLIFLDQLNDASDGFPATGDLFMCDSGPPCSNQGTNEFARSGRAQIQAVTVTAINGNQLTISPPVAMPNFRSGQTPGVWWASTTPLRNAGIEHMTIDHTGAGQVQGLMVANCVNCWLQGMRFIYTATATQNVLPIHLFQSAHVTIRSNYIYGPQNASGSPFNVYAYSDSLVSDVLVENNIFHRNVTPIIPNDPSSGNVYSYNYVDAAYLFGSTFQYHSGPVVKALLEGNNLKTILADIIHGPHFMNTHFRNHLDGTNHNDAATTDMANPVHYNNRFFNMIGNVMGFSGWSIYEQSAQDGNLQVNDERTVWYLGSRGTSTPALSSDDANVERTMLRWGNWDNVTSTNDTGTNDSTGTRFVSGEVPSGITNYPNAVPASQTLPASFYRTSIPSTWWQTPWGTPPWPPIGPDVSNGNAPNTATYPTGGHANKIPARLCFENTGNDGAYSTTPAVKAFDASSCYQAISGSPTPTVLRVLR